MRGESDSEMQARLVRGFRRWAVILRAVGLLDEGGEEEFLRRPWKPVPGRYEAHAAWLAAGKPKAPGEDGHDEAAWGRFTRAIGRG